MPFSPRSLGKRARVLLTFGVLAICSLAILACGAAANTGSTVSTSGSTASSSSSGSNSTASTASTAAKAPQHFKVGDQVKVGSTYIVTVNSVKASQGDEIDQPKAGNQYMIVDVTVQNVSSSEQDFSSLLSFTLKDSTGQKYDQAFVSGATSPDGKIEPNDKLRGQLAYEVPTAQHGYTLGFEADILSSGQSIWDLSL